MGHVFTTRSEIDALDVRRSERHDAPWEQDDYASLIDMFKEGHSLRHICDKLDRSATGVLAQLKKMGGVIHDPEKTTYIYALVEPTTLASTQEKTMSNNTQPLSTITYLFGNDIKGCTPDKLIKVIQQCQTEVATHTALPTNAYSTRRMEELTLAINAAVNELNTRA